MISIEESIHIRIGNNIENIRKKRGISLDKLAELTGVSKAMLYRIEQGTSQPTVTIVWKIASGLNISFSSLLKESETKISIVQKKEADITEDNGKCLVYLLFPFDPQTQMEIFTVTLKATGNYISESHNNGVLEYITVVSGELKLKIKDTFYCLKSGEAIKFEGNVTHQYINETNEDVVFQVVMHYPET
ncbi:helix-turn-helix domain-containing protein [Niallia sp. 03133]|uniref:helix-turn-helix domain-containing protein n=1 Tax=Niallia sp. 03133 TaxID=3458060 RepID=UPI004043C4B9